MASAIEVEPSFDALRAKHAELTRKYDELVERLERRSAHDVAFYRLSSFGLRAASAGLALIADRRIQVFNARFAQLARSIKGGLIPLEPEQGPLQADLRALVLAHAEGLLKERKAAVERTYRAAGSAAVVSIRFERTLRLGRPLVLVIAEDVTEHAAGDQGPTRTREALLHRERLRVLGELAASIAHDLGNTLRGASFQLTTLREAVLPQQKRAEAVAAVTQRVELASAAIARLHDFARTGTLGVTAVRLDRIVAQAAALVETEFQSSAAPVNVRVSIPDLPPVRGSVSELSFLFVNLLRNARDAMPDGGTVTVAARRARQSVWVTVADQGSGITREAKGRLFEPFFTTKGSNGMGLGLWLAAGTMERLGGSIRAANRPGRCGALFVLGFPTEDVGRTDQRRDAGRGDQRRSRAKARHGGVRTPSNPTPHPRRGSPA